FPPSLCRGPPPPPLSPLSLHDALPISLVARQDERGCCALQGRYGVLNRQEGWRAALMAAAFDLFNHVRPLGSDRLGLSVGLKGKDRKSTRLNSSHLGISYAVFCLKKKK